MIMEEKSKKKEDQLAQQREKTERNQIVTEARFDDSDDSARKREELRKNMADRMNKPPPIKFYDSKIFETDLKYFREWFRIQEKNNKDKYDYFYGPLEPDELKRKEINQKRLDRVKKKLASPPRGRQLKYSISYSPPKKYDKQSQTNRFSTVQRYDVTIDENAAARQNESNESSDID